MGWVFYDSHYYKSNGKVDRKKEIDSKFNENDTVVKSAMVGSTYYAAIKNTNTNEVFAYIALTSQDDRHGFNFGYKDMDETCGPYESKCPNSILKLLSPTTNEWALQWREKCREYHIQKKSPGLFSSLPLGTKIIWTIPSDNFTGGEKGEKQELIKLKFGHRHACWYNQKEGWRTNSRNVNSKDYVIVSDESIV